MEVKAPLERRLSAAALCCSLGVLGVAATALAAWIEPRAQTPGVHTTTVAMAISTALCLITLAICLAALSRADGRYHSAARAAAIAVAAITLLRVAELLAGVSNGFDRWLFHAPQSTLQAIPLGQMAQITALSLLTAALGLVLMSYPREVTRSASFFPAILVFMIGLLVSGGYAYGAPLQYGSTTIPVAFNTAVALLLLGAGMVAVIAAGEAGERFRIATALQEQTSRLSMIGETQRQLLTTEPEPGAVMNLIADRACELTQAAGAVVEIPEGDEMVYRAVSGSASPHLGLRLKAETSISGLCLRTGQVLRCDDTETDDRTDRDACRRIGVRSMVLAPLHHGSKTIGVLKVLAPQPGFFDEAQAQLLEVMADFLAAALDRALLFESQQSLLNDLQTALERQEAAKTALSAAKIEAETASSAKSEFLSRMSHELRTPMNSILGFAQLLEMENLPSRQAEEVRHILSAGNHLLELINEVLDLSRIESGNLAVHREAVDVHDALQRSLDMIRPLANNAGVRVFALGVNGRDIPPNSDEIAATGVKVLADRQRLHQVLLNLLSNAVKYNHGEGAAISLRLEEASVNQLRIMIHDNGPGIAPENAAKLFQPFERLDAERQSIEGTGIGLSLSKRLVELMDGTIGVESTPGEGSCFWVQLPLAAAAVEQVSWEWHA